MLTLNGLFCIYTQLISPYAAELHPPLSIKQTPDTWRLSFLPLSVSAVTFSRCSTEGKVPLLAKKKKAEREIERLYTLFIGACVWEDVTELVSSASYRSAMKVKSHCEQNAKSLIMALQRSVSLRLREKQRRESALSVGCSRCN